MRVRPFIVPVFIPQAGCPHRCVFCNQAAITGQRSVQADSGDWLVRVKEFFRFRRDDGRAVQIAFFGGNFLGLPAERMNRLLDETSDLIQAGEAQGIRFSTRPDTVSRQALDLLERFPVQTIEVGAQSMDDEVLRFSRRGHTAADTAAAVALLTDRGYEVGLQVMVGLPGDDEARLMETGRRIADLKPGFVRIYPTLVLAGNQPDQLCPGNFQDRRGQTARLQCGGLCQKRDRADSQGSSCCSAALHQQHCGTDPEDSPPRWPNRDPLHRGLS